MKICHSHNLVADKKDEPKSYGIRVRLPAQDTFRLVLGGDWEKFHWFDSESDRDTQMDDMRRQHEYSRAGDRPTIVLAKVRRDESGNIVAD